MHPIHRSVQTESLPPSASLEILNKQRLNRPSSPHFTIYQPQLTWLGSIVNRVTGSALSVRTYPFRLLSLNTWLTTHLLLVLYGFSIAYLVAPGTFDSVHIVETVASLPESVKYAGKAILAAPFAFHSLNGLRHLGWDMGKCTFVLPLTFSPSTYYYPAVLSVKGAYVTGYIVIGASAISTVALTLMK